MPCEGLGEHAHFKDFGMAFLTLFRVATGDNWNGIMKVFPCTYFMNCLLNYLLYGYTSILWKIFFLKQKG